MIFGIKENKIDNFDPYNVLLAIATNIPQRLKTGFVLQGHKCHSAQNINGPFLNAEYVLLLPFGKNYDLEIMVL